VDRWRRCPARAVKECGGAVITDSNLDAGLGRADTSTRAVRTPQQIAAIRWTNQFYQGNKLEYTVWGRTGGLIQMPNSYLTGAA